jgi:transposase InsO family protein
LTSRRFLSWSLEKRVRATTILPGKPIQNAHIESFNGRLRDECLNVSWFSNHPRDFVDLVTLRGEFPMKVEDKNGLNNDTSKPGKSYPFLVEKKGSRQWC